MRKRYFVLAVALLSLVIFVAPVSVLGDPPTLDKIVFIDYVAPVHARLTASAATDSCGDSSSYKTLGVKWTEFPVTYSVDVTDTAAKQAVVNAFNTWDAEQHPNLQFFAGAASGTTPKVTVYWASIDGPGGTLAVTTVWYYVVTKAIVKATVKFDADDGWGVLSGTYCYGKGTGTLFDIQDVATHEIGHVVGLGHPASSSVNVPLTMFAYATQGETYKTTLASGDKKGIAAVYR